MPAEHQLVDATTTNEQNVQASPIVGHRTNGYLVRIGGVSAIVGSIGTFLSLMIRPMSDPADPIQQTLQTYAIEIANFDMHALGLFVGILLLLGGFVGLAESLRSDSGVSNAFARFGLFAAVVTTTMGLILAILDARVTPRLAQTWIEAPAGEQAAALGAVQALYTTHIVMVSRFHTLLALTFLLFGIAVWRSNGYHRWLGWAGVGLGAVAVLLGMLAQLHGIAPRPARLRVGVVLIALFVWFTLVGVSMWRMGGVTVATNSGAE